MRDSTLSAAASRDVTADHRCPRLVYSKQRQRCAGREVTQLAPGKSADITQRRRPRRKTRETHEPEQIVWRRRRAHPGDRGAGRLVMRRPRHDLPKIAHGRLQLRLRRGNRNVLVNPEKHIDDPRVVHCSAPFPDDLDCRGGAHRRSVWTVRDERVEAIHDRQNARADRNVFAAQARRVAGAVPVLVVRPDDRHDRIGEVDRGKNVRTQRHVRLHRVELLGREPAGLVENVLRDAQLAGVVEQRRGLDCLERSRIGDVKTLGEPHRVRLHTVNVIARHAVLGFNRR